MASHASRNTQSINGFSRLEDLDVGLKLGIDPVLIERKVIIHLDSWIERRLVAPSRVLGQAPAGIDRLVVHVPFDRTMRNVIGRLKFLHPDVRAWEVEDG